MNEVINWIGVKSMLKIGEFAKITGVSIYMLRNYDKVGLLVPSQVDDQTGYRYYDESQILIANQIQVFKSLGFGLKEIMILQAELDSKEKLTAFLKDKVEEKKKQQEEISNQIEKMQKAIEEIEESPTNHALEVNIKNFPSRNVVSLREDITTFAEEGRLLEKLLNLCREKQIRIAETEYAFAITHELDLIHHRIDTEVQFVVDKVYKVSKEIKSCNVPECQVAAIAFQGEYMQIGEIKAYMEGWIKENGYRLVDVPFTTYYRSPGNEVSPEQFITELCFPISKQGDVAES